MPVARPESSDSRIIAHVDMDCFYVQVEQRKQPELRGLPAAVVQYNSWKGGGLIAVGYEARKFGVKRSMRGDEAKKVCPDIHLVQVPVAHGKANLNIYRNAGSEVVSILSRKGKCERASIDEVYLDLTDAAETMLAESPPESLEAIDEEVLKSHILGLNTDGCDTQEKVREWLQRSDAFHRDKLLACGAFIAAELRLQVLKETEFTCSAGIAHNKMLAKLASGMNKPAQQTVVPLCSVKNLLESLPIKKMKQLGGKLGSSVQIDLGVNTVGDLLKFSEEKLQDRYGVNTGTWLWNTARGISGEEVEGRLLPKSHGSGKTFAGPSALKTIDSVKQWLNELCEELSERLQSDLDQNKRIAQTLTLHARAFKLKDSDSHTKFPSKSCPLRYGSPKILEDSLTLFQAGLRDYMGAYYNSESQGNRWRITGLSVTASKIVAKPSGTSSIMKYFHEVSRLGSTGELSSLPTDPQSENHNEETTVKSCVPNLDLQEDETVICTNEDDPCCSSFNDSRDAINREREILPSPSGANDASVNIAKSINQKQKSAIKEKKGTPSIMRFFQSQNNSCSSTTQERENTVQESSSHVNNSSQNEERADSWRYKIDEIDPTVMNELPLDIQDELRAFIRPHKQTKTAKRGPSIANYFLPTKNQ